MTEVIPGSGQFADGTFWFRRKGVMFTFGVTDEGLDSIGELESLILPEIGMEFEEGEEIFTLQGSKSSLEFVAPGEGRVEVVNEKVSEDLQVIHDDCEDEGWIIQLSLESAEGLDT